VRRLKKKAMLQNLGDKKEHEAFFCTEDSQISDDTAQNLVAWGDLAPGI
jgi:hypothetical protein